MTIKQDKKLLANKFVDALKTRPEDFTFDEFKLIDARSKKVWWIANGYKYFEIFPSEKGAWGLSWWQRWRCMLAFNTFKQKTIEQNSPIRKYILEMDSDYRNKTRLGSHE